MYSNLGEFDLALEQLKLAYALRERVSEHERYGISALYEDYVTGDSEKALQIYEEWQQAYPRDPFASGNLGATLNYLGRSEDGVPEILKASQLLPTDGAQYANLMAAYMSLNRFDEAHAAYENAMRVHSDPPSVHANRYILAFLEGDRLEMQRQFTWAEGKPGAADVALAQEADTQAYAGHIGRATQLSENAADTARHNEQSETAAQWLLNAALRDAEVGYVAEARHLLSSALALGTSQDLKRAEALLLARIGDVVKAQEIAEDIAKARPSDTLLNDYWIPTITGTIAMQRHKPMTAIEELKRAGRYELGSYGSMYPVYVRGEAYLQSGEVQLAAAEFQKFLTHRGVVCNGVLGALANLQLGRAKVLAGDQDGGRRAYQDFLALWKDADPDIPILKQAKAEYAKLQ